MSFLCPTRLELSRHEAGHAYASAALRDGDAPIEIGLGRNADGSDHGWCERQTMLYEMGRPLREFPEEQQPPLARSAAAEIIVALAGPLAEFRQRTPDGTCARARRETCPGSSCATILASCKPGTSLHDRRPAPTNAYAGSVEHGAVTDDRSG